MKMKRHRAGLSGASCSATSPALPHPPLSHMWARDPGQALAGAPPGSDPPLSYEVIRVVAWCGHLREVALVPDAEEWFREIPILGVAT